MCLDSAALRTTPRPPWALGGGVPFLTCLHPFHGLWESCQSQGCERALDLGNMCWGLLLRASLEEEDTPEELLPALYPTRSDAWAHTKRRSNTNGARCLTDAVRRSVQATFFRVLSQTGTSLLVVLQSQLASSSEGQAHQRPSSL